MKTKAAVLRQINEPLSIEELEIPALGFGQVLVKILASGLCHSQLNEIRGRKGRENIPHLLGHEASGIVIDIGPGVTKVIRDDYVVLSWIRGSGIEAEAPKYKSNIGMVSAGPVATFIEYAVISENRMVTITDKIRPPVAALLGCAVPTGMGIIRKLDIKKDQKVVVFGIGGVGSSALLKAKSLGANTTAVDVVDWKLNWARNELGIDSIVIPSMVKLNHFDFAIECSGNKQAMELAFESVHGKGEVVIAGNLEPGEKFSIDPFGLIRGKKLCGTWGGDGCIDSDTALYAQDYLDPKTKLPLDKLISAEYSFDDINQGLRYLATGMLIRGIIKMV